MAYDGVIKTQTSEMFRVATTDITTAGTTIANPACQANQPSGPGIFKMGAGNAAYASNGILLLPYGVGAAGNSFNMSVFGWEHINPVIAQNAGVWVAFLLASFTCTLCTVAGIPGGEVDNTHLFCDTVVENIGNANVSNEVVSPTGNVLAHILLDAKGTHLIQVAFAVNNSTAANAIARRL